jgi:nitrogen fixation NifU-like protein
MYSDLVMEHFANPRNVGEVEDPDGVGEIGNPVCGDVMRLTIKVAHGRIADAKFKTFGCGAAVATSSMVTEMVKGKTLQEALEVSNRAVAEALGGLPPAKMHCSNLAADALHIAIDDYLERGRSGAGGNGKGARHAGPATRTRGESPSHHGREDVTCTLALPEESSVATASRDPKKAASS